MSVLGRGLYRSRQFFGALRPNIDEDLKAEAFRVLNDQEQLLFSSMSPRDRQHCLDVFRALRERGHGDRHLLAAALLHDCGKGYVALWHRVAFVVAEATAPALLDRVIAPGDGPGWRQSLYRLRHHEEIGADLARRAGSSSVTIELIRSSPSPELREPLAALEGADDSV
jgi:hypothetical protein